MDQMEVAETVTCLPPFERFARLSSLDTCSGVEVYKSTDLLEDDHSKDPKSAKIPRLYLALQGSSCICRGLMAPHATYALVPCGI